MNRSFISVILGGYDGETAAAGGGSGEQKPAKLSAADGAAFIMTKAPKVIIVPGYGLPVLRVWKAGTVMFIKRALHQDMQASITRVLSRQHYVVARRRQEGRRKHRQGDVSAPSPRGFPWSPFLQLTAAESSRMSALQRTPHVFTTTRIIGTDLA